MFLLTRMLLIMFLICFGVVHVQAYDPEHSNGATGVLDDDGDRDPGTVFPLDVTTCGGGSPDALCSELASFGASTTNLISTGIYDYSFATPTGGRIINIKDAPFGATGNGSTDDTLAFQKAFNFIVSTLYVDSNGGTGGGTNWYSAANPGGDNNYIIYVPDGTYKITDTITYKTKWTAGGTTYRLKINDVTYGSNSCTDGEILYAASGDDNAVVSADCTQPAGQPEAIARIRIIGESRSGVVFQLADGATGFTSSGTPKAVIGFGNINANFNSSVSFNALRNLTIDLGNDNFGAVGVLFAGANNSGIANVAIQADETAKYGIYIKHSSTQGYHRDINIDNFETGIYVEHYNAAHATFEHVSISDSQSSAIETLDMGLSLRKILVNNGEVSCSPPVTPAIKMTSAAQVVLVDSTLTSGYSCFQTDSEADLNIAIDVVDSSHIHTRGLKVDGDEDIYRSDYSNYSDGVLQTLLLPDLHPTLALQPKNPSRYTYSGLTVKIISDQTELADCLAMDGTPCSSGTSYALFLPESTYAFSGGSLPYIVPNNVKVINFLYGEFTSSAYLFKSKVTGSSADGALVIEDVTSSGQLYNHLTGTRPVVLRHVGGTSNPYNNGSGAMQDVYFESVVGVGAITLNQVNAWARGINRERASTAGVDITAANFPIDGGSKLWVLGYKTEKNQPSFSVNHDDDQLEVLGGLVNQRAGAFSVANDGDDPNDAGYEYSVLAIKNADAEVSYIGFTSGIGGCPQSAEYHFDEIVRVQDNGSAWHSTEWGDYPGRNIANRCNDIFIMLDLDGDGLGDADELATLGTDPFNRLDPPHANLSREHLAVVDDKDYLNTDYARYIIWHMDEFQNAGPVGRTIDDVIAPGYTYGCVVDDGEVDCGDGTLTEIVKAQVGDEYSCALKVNGHIYCWYRADIDGTADDITGNLASLSLSIRDLAIHNGSDTYGCAVDGGSDYDCWEMDGAYSDDNPFVDYTSPSPSLTSLTSVAVGAYHVCVINAGYIHCRVTDDTSYSAQLGDSDADGYVDIAGTEITDARKIAAGDSFTCVLRGAYETGSGTVHCWGSAVPSVSGLNDPVSITALNNRLCVIDAGVTNQENAVNSLKCFPDLDTDGDSTLDGSDTDDDNDGVSDTTEGSNGTERVLVDTDGDDYCDGNGAGCAGLTGNNDAYPLDPTQH